jgi:ADP-ribosylation factor-binding protein GGA
MMLGGSNGTPWFRASKLEMLVQSACDPTLHEPNYAIHLEIAELINTKKANKSVNTALAMSSPDIELALARQRCS